MLTVKAPGSKSLMKNSPWALEATLVPRGCSSIRAPCKMPPELSVTWPVMAPLPDCARAGRAIITTATNATKSFFPLDIYTPSTRKTTKLLKRQQLGRWGDNYNLEKTGPVLANYLGGGMLMGDEWGFTNV